MFLDAVLARNPELVDVAVSLHRSGAVPPDTYVIDADTVEANAALLAGEAERLGLSLWFVVKQIGRNPALIGAIARHIPGSRRSIRTRRGCCTMRGHGPGIWVISYRSRPVCCRRCSAGGRRR